MGFGTVRCGAAWHGQVRQLRTGVARWGLVRFGMVRSGEIRYGKVRCGEAWQERRGTAWRGQVC